MTAVSIASPDIQHVVRRLYRSLHEALSRTQWILATNTFGFAKKWHIGQVWASLDLRIVCKPYMISETLIKAIYHSLVMD